MKRLSELSWKKRDYVRHGQEVPERLLHDEESCEGELMTEEEIEQYLADGVSTCKVLADKGSPRFAEVQAGFFGDLAYLVSIGRLEPELYHEIMKEDNYRF
jgi:hypothetical protein